MSRRPRPPSGDTVLRGMGRPPSGKCREATGRPPSGSSGSSVNTTSNIGRPPSGKSRAAAAAIAAEKHHGAFGLNIASAGVHEHVKQTAKDSAKSHVEYEQAGNTCMTRVQFADTCGGEESTYNFQPELSSHDAVFITDLPHDPHFHGYYPPPPPLPKETPGDPLDNAFNALNDQISSMLTGTETQSTQAHYSHGDNESRDGQSLKSILKSRPHSATTPRTKCTSAGKRRPFSANDSSLFGTRSDVTSRDDDSVSNDDATTVTSHMEPVVYSLSTGKQIGGMEYQAAVAKEQEELRTQDCHNHQQPEAPSSAQQALPGLPSCLRHLTSWNPTNTTSVGSDTTQINLLRDVTGLDTSQCHVFLPCLTEMKSFANLRVVPSPQSQNEELNFVEKFPAQKPLIKTRRALETVECNHGSRMRDGKVISTPRIKVLANDGHILHETYGGPRNPEVVRREIQELEDLMKGIGSSDGCMVVQLQAQINDINDTLNKMAPTLERIRRREEEKRKQTEPEDHFGMRAFYEKHDDVIKQIRHQHRLCVLELSDIESSLGIETPRAHFKSHEKNIRAPSKSVVQKETSQQNDEKNVDIKHIQGDHSTRIKNREHESNKNVQAGQNKGAHKDKAFQHQQALEDDAYAMWMPEVYDWAKDKK